MKTADRPPRAKGCGRFGWPRCCPPGQHIACGGLVRFERRGDGVHWFVERVSWSGNRTIRIIPFRNGPLRRSRDEVLRLVDRVGVTGEGIEQFGMVALDVPPDADLSAVTKLLREGEADRRWTYEESCISDAWVEADAGPA